MNVLEIVSGILLIIASILIIVIVLMQDSKQSGMSAMTGQAESYLSKNKSKTLESKLVKITKIFTIAFFILTIAVNLIIRYVK